MLSSKQLKKYFKRIKQSELYDLIQSGKADLNFATLRQIQLAHVLTFPFENLDMHNVINHPNEHATSIETDDIFTKMVEGTRGGYCFETNELLRQVLLSIGFDVKTFNAGVIWLKPQKLKACHEMLIVKVGECEYLAESGFGMPGPLEPLLFRINGKLNEAEQEFPQHEVKRFRFIVDEDGEYQLQGQVKIDWRPESPWKPLYAFKTNVECTPEEFARGHHLVTVTDQSPFLQRLFVTQPTALEGNRIGRITLLHHVYKISTPDGVTELPVYSQEHFMEILKSVFDITLPPGSSLTAKQVRFPVPALQERAAEPKEQDRTCEPQPKELDLQGRLASLLTTPSSIEVPIEAQTSMAPSLTPTFALQVAESELAAAVPIVSMPASPRNGLHKGMQ